MQVQTFLTSIQACSHVSESGAHPGAVNTHAEAAVLQRLAFRVEASKLKLHK